MGIHVANAEQLAYEACAGAWMPPPPVDYLKWALDNVQFSERESPFPGGYNEELFPYFSEILRALSPEDPCQIVTMRKSAQIGGTVLANIFCGGTLDLAPSDFLYVHPTENNASRWSRLKLTPMLKNTTALAKIFSLKGSRDGADSTLFKERKDGRGSILISGANSPASLSQVSMPRQVQDDLSKWEMNAAGDPETQSNSRSRGYEFRKIFKISTPLIIPGCRISANFEEGSQERYHLPCPHCDHFQVLEWENMQAHLSEEHPENAHFVCVECGCEIHEHHRNAMLRSRRGKWIAENPSAKRHHRSFDLWSAYSILQSFETIAREWFSAKGDPASEQTFFNDTVGRPYKTEGDAPPWEELRDRAAKSHYARGQVPARGLVITIGFDCQGDRVEWQAVAFGRDGYRAVIDYGVITGHIGDKTIYPRLDAMLQREWQHVSGQRLKADRSAIDGNAYTEDVWSWAKRHPVSKVIMVRGVPQEYAPLIAQVKKQRSSDGKKVLRYAKRFYNFAASVLKMSFYKKVRKTDSGKFGYVDFPRGLEDEYFMQLTAERRVPKQKNGFTYYIWEKDPAQANEALDTMNQAETAANNLRVRDYVDAEWDRLELARNTPPEDPQLDLETTTAVPAEVPAEKPAVKSKQRRSSRRKRKYMNT